MRLEFGKYRGHQLDEVPASYLAWLLEEARTLDAALRRAIRAELADRIGATLGGHPVTPRLLPAPDVANAAASIIDTGFRVVAKATHPDIGGSHGAMLAVGSARDYLRRAITCGVAA